MKQHQHLDASPSFRADELAGTANQELQHHRLILFLTFSVCLGRAQTSSLLQTGHETHAGCSSLGSCNNPSHPSAHKSPPQGAPSSDFDVDISAVSGRRSYWAPSTGCRPSGSTSWGLDGAASPGKRHWHTGERREKQKMC